MLSRQTPPGTRTTPLPDSLVTPTTMLMIQEGREDLASECPTENFVFPYAPETDPFGKGHTTAPLLSSDSTSLLGLSPWLLPAPGLCVSVLPPCYPETLSTGWAGRGELSKPAPNQKCPTFIKIHFLPSLEKGAKEPSAE